VTRRPSPPWPAWFLRVAGGLALAVIWETAGQMSDSLLLPRFTETAAALASLTASRELWAAFWISNQALLTGFAASVVIGMPLGIALGRSPALDRWVDPYIHLLLVVPTTALIPIIFMLSGPGLLTRAVVVSTFALPIVMQCARTAIRQVDPRLRDIARSFCATTTQEWRTVILPAAVPGLALGVRLGLARAVEGMVVVELLLVAVGVGGLLLDFQGRFDAPRVYAVILVVMAEAALLSHAGRRLERRFAPASAGGRVAAGARA